MTHQKKRSNLLNCLFCFMLGVLICYIFLSDKVGNEFKENKSVQLQEIPKSKSKDSAQLSKIKSENLPSKQQNSNLVDSAVTDEKKDKIITFETTSDEGSNIVTPNIKPQINKYQLDISENQIDWLENNLDSIKNEISFSREPRGWRVSNLKPGAQIQKLGFRLNMLVVEEDLSRLNTTNSENIVGRVTNILNELTN